MRVPQTPWSWHGAVSLGSCKILDARRQPVAIVVSSDYDMNVGTLVAAAPELATAVQMLLAKARTLDWIQRPDAEIAVAEAALAKAGFNF